MKGEGEKREENRWSEQKEGQKPRELMRNRFVFSSSFSDRKYVLFDACVQPSKGRPHT